MSDVFEAVRQLLLTDADINVSVGGTRVVSDQMPEGMETPCIVYYLISTDTTSILVNVVNASISRFQVDAFAASRPAASRLQRMVARRMAAFDGTVNGYCLKTSRLSGERADTDRPDMGSAGFRYISSIDYQVLHFPFETQ
tara:strand:+ start:2998 stop:3420 length:423 start_codon:yes stop_codon:yes gene_type:complete